MNHGQLHSIMYVAGKARSMDAAESLRERTQAVLDKLENGQTARVNRIANAHGTYGYRVNVTCSILKGN